MNFGLDDSLVYDCLVIAPNWTPLKIIRDDSFKITTLITRSYISGYLVEKDGLKIAWVQVASGACNLLDHLVVCSELNFKKLIFIGAVGSLSEDFNVGDLCTPSYSISGVFSNAYLSENLNDYKPFEKVYPNDKYIDEVIGFAKNKGYNIRKGSVFCTDSIALEYYHLDEIKKFKTDLIEMETSTFYMLAELLEVPSIALLVVSDNSMTNKPLVGMKEEMKEVFDRSRKDIIPELIDSIRKDL